MHMWLCAKYTASGVLVSDVLLFTAHNIVKVEQPFLLVSGTGVVNQVGLTTQCMIVHCWHHSTDKICMPPAAAVSEASSTTGVWCISNDVTCQE